MDKIDEVPLEKQTENQEKEVETKVDDSQETKDISIDDQDDIIEKLQKYSDNPENLNPLDTPQYNQESSESTVQEPNEDSNDSNTSENSDINIETIQPNEEDEPEEIHSKKDTKILIWMIVIVIAIFAISLGGLKFFDDAPTGNIVVDVDKQHLNNKEGLLDEDEGYMLNGFSFIKSDGLWWTERKTENRLIKIPMHHDPKSVTYIPLTGELDPLFNKGNEIYVSIDPNVVNKFYTLAVAELSFNIAKGVNRDPVGSCTENSTDCADRDIVSCANPQGKPIVELAVGETEKVEYMGTCIKVTGKDQGLVKAVDRMLYKWYGMVD